MQDVIRIMKGLAVSAFMARLGIGRLIGCSILLVIVACTCTGLLVFQLLSSS
jgi:hypothetical protein